MATYEASNLARYVWNEGKRERELLMVYDILTIYNISTTIELWYKYYDASNLFL